MASTAVGDALRLGGDVEVSSRASSVGQAAASGGDLRYARGRCVALPLRALYSSRAAPDFSARDHAVGHQECPVRAESGCGGR